jgi:hypothetical protein
VSAPILGTVLNQAATSVTGSYAYGGYEATPPPPSDQTFEIERPSAEELAELEAAIAGTDLEPPATPAAVVNQPVDDLAWLDEQLTARPPEGPAVGGRTDDNQPTTGWP